MQTLRVVLIVFAATAIGCSGSDGDTGPAGPPGDPGPQGDVGDPGPPGQDVDIGYAGSAACEDCHAEHYAGWMASAHPYKIVAKDDVVAGTAYPDWVSALQGEAFAMDADFFTDQAALISINGNTFPNGGFDDVTYVIGGYGWKARFIGTDGYIITGTDNGTPADTTDDDKIQYNLPYNPHVFGMDAYPDVPASSATYHTGEMKPYTCGGCHTTGWIPDDDADTDGDLSDNQDGLAGIHGTWVETGVGCEGCHGPSAGHTADPFQVTTSMPAKDSCGGCHVRGWPWEIDTKGGFIRHHEQFEELVNSKHAAIGCVGCHDSHQPVQYRERYMELDGTGGDPNPDFTNRSGIRTQCTTCHWEKQVSYDLWAAATVPQMAAVTCTQCHMPSAAKSAVKAGTYHGDVRSHLFGINMLVDPGANPELTTTGANPANPYLSLDWACGGCHADTAEGTDVVNPDLYIWATTALQANGGVHGGN